MFRKSMLRSSLCKHSGKYICCKIDLLAAATNKIDNAEKNV